MKEIKDFKKIEYETRVMRTGKGRKLEIASMRPLELGSLMKVVDPSGRKYLIRITDHTNGKISDSNRYILRSWMSPERQKTFWKNDAFLIGKLEGDSPLGRLSSIKWKPRQGSRITELDEDIFYFEKPYFATQKGNKDIKVGIHPKTVTNHIAILGKTGSGKTNTGAVLLSQLHGLGKAIPVIAESSFSLIKRLAKNYYAKAKDDFVILSTSEYNRGKCKKFRIDERNIKKLKINPNELTPKAFCLATGVGRNTTYENIIYNTWYNTKKEKRGDKWFENLKEKVESDDLHRKTRGALNRRINRLKRMPWIEEDGLELYDFLRKCIREGRAVLIDLQDSQGALRPMGILLARKLQYICRRRKKRGNSDIPVLLALDEAHQWLNKNKKGVEEFIRTIKMVRKWDMGMMFMTQEASQMDSRFFDQVGGLTICHKLKSEDEAREVEKHFASRVGKEELVSLNDKGEAMYESNTEKSLNIAMRLQVFGPFEEWIEEVEYECEECGKKVKLYELTDKGGKQVCNDCAIDNIDMEI